MTRKDSLEIVTPSDSRRVWVSSVVATLMSTGLGITCSFAANGSPAASWWRP